MSTKQLTFIGFILLVIAIAVAFMAPWASQQPTASADVTPPSPEIVAMVQASKGSQYRVSYTDAGFEPMSLTVRQGETVRFTNNSSHDLWISEISPSAPTMCNDATFNSCRALKQSEFLEHTFSTIDTLQYEDTLNPANTATIQIK